MKKLLVLLLFVGVAQAQSPDGIGTGEFLLHNAAAADWVSGMQLGTRVDIAVSGLVAEVTVEQRFHNDSGDWAEGKYLFPLPETAAVSAMTIRIGERVIVGEIHEKQAAKHIYEAARSQGQRAALVQQSRPNLFSSHVANIGPDEEISVTLTYLQKVDYERGQFSLRFPMTLTPRYQPGGDAIGERTPPADFTPRSTTLASAPANPSNPVTVSADIDAGLPLAHVSSTYHDVRIERRAGVYGVRLADGPVAMDRDFELTWQPVASASPQVAAFTQTVDDERYALVMVVPPETTSTTALRREIVFIIDTSGSMSGASMEQAKIALGAALNALSPDDTFNIIAFNHEATRLFADARLASGAYLYEAQRFVDGLQSDGGTEMRPALEAALLNQRELPPDVLRQLVFITDGAVGNEAELFRLIDENLGESRLFTVGIGSAPNSYFMRKAAQYGRGTFTYIARPDEVQGKMAGLFAQLQQPVLRNVRVAWPGRAERFPIRTPDLYAGQPLVVTARLEGAYGYEQAGVEVTGLTVNGSWRQLVTLDSKDHAGIATLWARDKIEALSDRITEEGESDALRDAIIDVALLHQIVSRYTSFVAVEKTPARPLDASLKNGPVTNARPAGQTGPTFTYPQTATTAMEQFWLGVLSLAVALQIVWLRRRYPTTPAIRTSGVSNDA